MARHASLACLDRPFAVMGIVNVTPDSFSDGGAFFDTDRAAAHALALVEQGAACIDIGGESSRPGAAAVPEDEECRRVLPVIEALAARIDVPISVDTTKSTVARRALDAGADWINDISAGRRDPEMKKLAASRGCPVILMHSRKTPHTMQDDPFYDDAVADVCAELRGAVEAFAEQGVHKENVVIDPGIGFAKRFDDNITLLRNLPALHALGFPVLLGTSRKSFIGRITGKDASQRVEGSLATVAWAFLQGTRFFRVHDVSQTIDLLKVLQTLRHP